MQQDAALLKKADAAAARLDQSPEDAQPLQRLHEDDAAAAAGNASQTIVRLGDDGGDNDEARAAASAPAPPAAAAAAAPSSASNRELARYALRAVFGFAAFRGVQEDVVTHV